MKKLILIMMTLLPAIMYGAKVNVDSILNALDKTIDRRDYYYMVKETRIDSLKQILHSKTQDQTQRRDVVTKLFDEYSKFQGDSAKRYALMLNELPANTPDDKVRANIALIFVYNSGGLFYNAIQTIHNTDLKGASDDVKGDFYFLLTRVYSDMSNYVSPSFDDEYAILSRAYSDSVITYKNPESYQAHYANVFKTSQSMSQQEKIAEFQGLLNRSDLDLSEKAMIASMLADLYRDLPNRDSMIYYKALSANMDILSGKHETTASRDLALYLYENGDIDRASRLINIAQADAKFFNGRHRLAEIANILPLIEQKRYDNVSSQRNTLIWVVVLFALLVMALATSIFYIVKQMRIAKRQRMEIEKQSEVIASAKTEIELQNAELKQAHTEIEQQNADLKTANRLLHESNRIKDEYIGFGFSISASYMDKIDELYKFVDRKLQAQQYDDLRKSLRHRDLREDKEEVLSRFDKMFLRLFPSYIKKYNELFPAEEASNPGDEETLTSEMRIFALIRLGISDSSKIATLLNYSVNTVNTYKTKAKNRSFIPNEKFEAKIMDIKSISV